MRKRSLDERVRGERSVKPNRAPKGYDAQAEDERKHAEP